MSGMQGGQWRASADEIAAAADDHGPALRRQSRSVLASEPRSEMVAGAHDVSCSWIAPSGLRRMPPETSPMSDGGR